MVRRRWYTGGLAIAVLVFAAAATGQERSDSSASPEDQALDTLRTREPASMDDPVFDNWIDAELIKLNAAVADPLEGPEAANRFANRCRREYNNDKNSVGFKRRLAERLAARCQTEFDKGADLAPVAARALARALAGLNSVSARDGLLAGLSFPDQVVRYLSANALASIKTDIAADDRLTEAALEDIARRCRDEVNGVVAGAVYRALAYEDHPAQSVAAIVDVLEGRVDQLRSTQLELGHAELPAIRFLQSVNIGGEANKVKVVGPLAVLLRIHVQRFGQKNVSDREQAAIAETIFETESLIEKLVAPPGRAPNIRDKMQKNDPGAALNMEIELNQWIGTEQTEGLLNGSPWNVSRGAP